MILCVYNEESNIRDCLNSIIDQTRLPDEILIIDDYSTDDTISIINDYIDRLNIRIEKNPGEKGLRPARAYGMTKGHGNIKVTIDADEVLDKKCIENLELKFQDPSIGAVGGVIIPIGNSLIVKGEEVIEQITINYRINDFNVGFISGGCAAFRSDALEMIGGLSRGNVGEDIDASWKIRDLGYKVLISKEVIVYHRGPISISEILRREYSAGGRAWMLYTIHKRKIVNWKVFARFYPFFLFPLLFLSVRIVLFIYFLGLFFIIYKNIDDHLSSRIVNSIIGWVVFQIKNLAWVAGFISMIFFNGGS